MTGIRHGVNRVRARKQRNGRGAVIPSPASVGAPAALASRRASADWPSPKVASAGDKVTLLSSPYALAEDQSEFSKRALPFPISSPIVLLAVLGRDGDGDGDGDDDV